MWNGRRKARKLSGLLSSIRRKSKENAVRPIPVFPTEEINHGLNPLKEFSRKNGDAGTPKLVRLFQTPDFPKIESDPDFSEFFEVEAYRTPNDISRNLIRQGKDANRYSEEILTTLKKHVENKFNVSLNIDEIERALLDSAESDSDDDFL